MVYPSLPDEILKEILTPVLHVPDDAFACIATKSPFSGPSPKASSYLLVCKDWLRVATPLLYNVIILRSKAQIQALEAAIRRLPLLGYYIKKLRVESGFCLSLFSILRGTRRLTDLCVSLEVYGSDNIFGFCRGLAHVQPCRLIVYDPRGYTASLRNQQVQCLSKALEEYIPKWETLTHVTLPEIGPSLSFISTANYHQLVPAILKSTSIQVVTVPITSDHYFPLWLPHLPQLKNLRQIILMSKHSRFRIDSNLVCQVKAHPRLNSLVIYQSSTGKVGFFDPKICLTEPEVVQKLMKGVATFPDVVWSNILTYALGLPEMEQYELSRLARAIDRTCHPRDRLQLAFVCKKFYNLFIPLYYRCVIISSGQDFASFLRVVMRHWRVGGHVKTLLTIQKDHNSILDGLHHLLIHLPNLSRVSTNLNWYQFTSGSSSNVTRYPVDLMDLQALETLGNTAGPRLVEMAVYLRRPCMPKSPEVFSEFTALKHLDLATSAMFTYDEATVKKNAFANLESIVSRCTHNSFMLFLSVMDLPKLHTASFPYMDRSDGAIIFLRRHGHKLHTLECGFLPVICVFDACPNLLAFELPEGRPGYPVAEFFSSSNKHPLKTLRIKHDDIVRGSEKDTFRYLGGVDLSNFTSLHQIQIDRCVWPMTENEIKRSNWVPWAERLQKLFGVDIVNRMGQIWVPRLQVKKE